MHTCGGEKERKKGREVNKQHISIYKKSIQFNNKDVHLNKRINEAKNSMKCDAIHHDIGEAVALKNCQLTP